MKNEVMNKPFPYNLFDDLEVKAPQEQAEDFLPTLMYILRCVSTPRDSRAILMRYKDGKTYEEIGEAFGLSKQRANYMIQEILCKFNDQYLAMLTKGIKRYYEDMLLERINVLEPTIEESSLETLQMNAYEKGYHQGYEDGVTGRKASATDERTLNTINISTLQLSTRTFNALCRNGIETLGDVIASGDKLLDFNAFGKTCFYEIANTLKTYGANIIATFPACVKKWGTV